LSKGTVKGEAEAWKGQQKKGGQKKEGKILG